MDDTLKTMLSTYVRAFERDVYEKVNRVVALVYEEWLQEEYRQQYLLEMLFHRIVIEKIKSSDDEAVCHLVSSQLLDYIEGRQKTGPGEVDGLDSLMHALEDDQDLRPFVERKVFDGIETVLRSRL